MVPFEDIGLDFGICIIHFPPFNSPISPYDFELDSLAETVGRLLTKDGPILANLANECNDLIIAYPVYPNGMEFRKNSIYV